MQAGGDEMGDKFSALLYMYNVMYDPRLLAWQTSILVARLHVYVYIA